MQRRLTLSSSPLPANLRLLCGYVPSITAAAREIGIDRALLHRYLAGACEPTLRNLRRICDYFGVEEYEILMDPGTFRDLVALRRPSPRVADPLGDHVRRLSDINPQAAKDIEPYLGYYFSHFRPEEFPGSIMRSLVRFRAAGVHVHTMTIENYAGFRRRRRRILRYRGVAFHSGERIFLYEREAAVGKMMWQCVLQPSEDDQSAVMTGLTMGVSSGMRRNICCYRTVFEYLGPQVRGREVLMAIGLFDERSDEIAPDIRDFTRNDIAEGETTLIARPWMDRPG